jgi:hypothetical protein
MQAHREREAERQRSDHLRDEREHTWSQVDWHRYLSNEDKRED